jgi:hypothetical protein
MRLRRLSTFAVLCVLVGAGAQPYCPASADARPDTADSEFLARDLEGRDGELAAVHAMRLLDSIASTEGTPGRTAHLNYLLDKLNPAAVTRPGSDLLAAGRIVQALDSRIRSSGPPFPGTSDVLLPLVGLGPPEFRDAVVKACQALVRHEHSKGSSAGSAGGLAARFSGAPPPPLPFVSDASRILWPTDGKTLVAALVGALSRAGSSPDAVPGPAGAFPAACLEELRARLGIDFAATEGWRKWWEEARGLPFEAILADAERRSRDEQLASWRKLLRRLRETGDGERLLLALEDTLETVYSPDIRVAAVTALGDFADWVLEVRVSDTPIEPAGEESAPDPRARLAARAVRSLVAIEEPKGSRIERSDVISAVMAALRRYQLFLEKDPKLLGEVTSIVSRRLQALTLEDFRSSREQLLETIRLAGALRVPDALGFVEGLLGSASADGEEDIEVLTAAAATLGRLLEKGLGEGSSKLLIANFRKVRTGPEKAIRELRRTCITALLSGSETPAVRAALLDFYQEVLRSAGDRDLRIPVLIGLGTLARQREPRALDALRNVLEEGRGFEPPEVVAAMDSMAYVGGEPALSAFLDYAPRVREKAVEEHLVKKIAGLVEAGDASFLASLLERIEGRALEEDSTKLLEIALAIAEQPSPAGIIARDKLDAADPAKIGAWWRANLVLLRSRDAVGDEEGFEKTLASLGEALLENSSLREKAPGVEAELAASRELLAVRASLLSKLSRAEPGGDAALVEEMARYASAGRSPRDRWRGMLWVYRKISGLSDPSTRSRLAALWRSRLAAPGNETVWSGLPESCRSKHLARVAALAERSRE